MTIREAKLELNRLVREAQNADYVPMADVERAIYLTKIIKEGQTNALFHPNHNRSWCNLLSFQTVKENKMLSIVISLLTLSMAFNAKLFSLYRLNKPPF